LVSRPLRDRLVHATFNDESLGVGGASDPRATWREFCSAWQIFDGPSEMAGNGTVSLFGSKRLPRETMRIDSMSRLRRLAEPSFRPRTLMASFGIAILATTDDPLDDLVAHLSLRADTSYESSHSYLSSRQVRQRPFGGFRAERGSPHRGGRRGAKGYEGYLTALRNSGNTSSTRGPSRLTMACGRR